jgi:hypothetical protein
LTPTQPPTPPASAQRRALLRLRLRRSSPAEGSRLPHQRGGAGKRSQRDRKEKEYALGGKPQTET